MMSKPAPLSYTIQTGPAAGHSVTLTDPSQLTEQAGVPVIKGGVAKIDGKPRALCVRYDDKPELAAAVRDWQAQWAAAEQDEAAAFARNVPGLDELRAAQDAAADEADRYDRQFGRMMADEHNDGVRPPRSLDESLSDRASRLADQYPRAAVYLRAEGYTLAANDRKSSAGNRAMEIIAAGDDLADAQRVLDTWHEAAMWD